MAALILAVFAVLIVAAALVWRCAIRPKVARHTAMIVDGAIIVLALFGQPFGVLIALYAFARDSHYYGFWGQGDRARPSRPWLGAHPGNLPR